MTLDSQDANMTLTAPTRTCTMPLRIVRTHDAAVGIRSFELMRDDGTDLPEFSPGAHIRVQVPSADVRKYSLCNSPSDRTRYVITVKREDQGRGGSVSLVDQAMVGDEIMVSMPDNAFALVDQPGQLTFIAGGIGITPIICMIRSFAASPPCPWRLVYLTRSAQTTAFRAELGSASIKSHVTMHHDNGNPQHAFDLWPLLEKPNRGHVYCCGPRGLMEAVRDMSGHWSPGRIHFESFVEGGVQHPDDRTFVVTLARTGKQLEVPAGKTILATLLEANVPIGYSCESGTCGSCRTQVLAGTPEHRDMVLLPEEQASQIMVCVSRASSEQLVLDL